MRHIFSTLGLALSLVSASACSHPQLTGRGSEVILLAPTATPACERIAALVGKSWGSVFFGDSLLDTAENSLRNKAAEAGASHVVATRRDPSAHAFFLEGDAYKCGPAAVPAPVPAPEAAPNPGPDASGVSPQPAQAPADATPLPPAAPTP